MAGPSIVSQVGGLFRPFVNICLLISVPQDLPNSRTLLSLTLVGYALVGLFLAVPLYGGTSGTMQTALDVAMLAIYTWLVLRMAGYGARFGQTLTALAGVGVIMGLVALPLVYSLSASDARGVDNVPATFGYLFLVGWLIVVYGHIFRHALSRPLPTGLFVSLGYLVLSALVMGLAFPGSTTG